MENGEMTGEEAPVEELDMNPLQEKAKYKYVVGRLDKELDQEWIKRYSRLMSALFTPREVVEAGIMSCAQSDKYKEWVKEVGEEYIPPSRRKDVEQ